MTTKILKKVRKLHRAIKQHQTEGTSSSLEFASTSISSSSGDCSFLKALVLALKLLIADLQTLLATAEADLQKCLEQQEEP